VHRARVVAVAVAALTFALVTVSPGAAGAAPADDESFYQPPSPLPHRAPGTIIRSAPIAAPPGAQAWKVLYHSRAADGHDTAVSGVVVAPEGKAPKGGRPVVSWAHGTTGLADQCAPSTRPAVASTLPYVRQLLDAGDVVAATDYEGLGTPGEHPYLVGQSEGRNVLDVARAARNLQDAGGSDRVLVVGHSQGGQSALFAGELASSYAPELHVLGVVAAAPAADLEHILGVDAGATGEAGGFLAMAVQGFHAAYPDVDPAAVLTPGALTKAQAATQQCVLATLQAFRADPTPIFSTDPLSVPALARVVHTNSAGNHPAGAPLLVVQGSADTTVPKVLTDAFDANACSLDDTVDYRVYDGATHTSVIAAAQDDVLTWLQDRVAGAPAPTTCP
jgi:pimeloyl-ACP methyl ester carboxylesterase